MKQCPYCGEIQDNSCFVKDTFDDFGNPVTVYDCSNCGCEWREAL